MKIVKMTVFSVLIFLVSALYLRPDFGFATVFGQVVSESTGLWMEPRGVVNYGTGTTEIINIGDGWFWVTAVPGSWELRFKTVFGKTLKVVEVETVKDDLINLGKIKISFKQTIVNRIDSSRSVKRSTPKGIRIKGSSIMKQKGVVRFIPADKNDLRLRPLTYFPVRWNTENIVPRIAGYIRINIVLFDPKRNKKAGQIASNIPLSKKMFNWQVGKTEGNRIVPKGAYILKLEMKSGQLISELPVTILK